MTLPANEFAAVLVNEVIEAPDGELPHVPFDDLSRERYCAQARLYRLALVLSVLLMQERDTPVLLAVRQSLEADVFGQPTEESIALLKDVQEAMRELSNLLAPTEKARELAWAHRWLAAIGLDVVNPITLQLFSMRWMSLYCAVTDSVRKIAAQ